MKPTTAETEVTRHTYPPEKWVSVGPVAKLFSVNPKTVAAWCRGILPGVRLPGGAHFRILWSDAVALWLVGRASVAGSADAPGRYETDKQRKARGEKARREMLAVK